MEHGLPVRSGPTAEELLNFTTAPPDPFSCTSAGCHNSEPAPQPHSGIANGSPAVFVARAPTRMVDIARQVRKPSAHHEAPGNSSSALRKSRAAGGSIIRSVACADCHNPHLVGAGIAEAPYASPMLRGVSGVDRNGVSIRSARYEYEVCFKCHGENAPDLNYVPRVLSVTNTRRAFDPTNPSYHPVVSMGKHLNTPSIPSSLNPAMNAARKQEREGAQLHAVSQLARQRHPQVDRRHRNVRQVEHATQVCKDRNRWRLLTRMPQAAILRSQKSRQKTRDHEERLIPCSVSASAILTPWVVETRSTTTPF